MAEKTYAYAQVIKLIEAMGLEPDEVVTIAADHEWLDVTTRNRKTGDFKQHHWRMTVPVFVNQEEN